MQREVREKLKSLHGLIKWTGVSVFVYMPKEGVFALDDTILEITGHSGVVDLDEVGHTEFVFGNTLESDHNMLQNLFQLSAEKEFNGYNCIIRAIKNSGEMIWLNLKVYVLERDQDGFPTFNQGFVIEVDNEDESLEEMRMNYESVDYQLIQYTAKENTFREITNPLLNTNNNEDADIYFSQIAHPHDLAEVKEKFNYFLKNPVNGYRYTYRVKGRSYTDEYLYNSSEWFVAKYGDDGRPEVCICLNQKFANKGINRLINNEQGDALSLIVDTIDSCIVDTDAHGRVTFINEKFKKIIGYYHKEINETYIKNFISYNHVSNENYEIISEEYKETSHHISLKRVSTLSDVELGLRWYEWNISIFIENSKVVRVLRIGNDITSNIVEKEQSERLLNYDGKTCLHNSYYLNNYLNLHKDKRIKLLLVNIGGMQEINNVYGYQKGDQYIKEVAHRAMSIENDDIPFVSRVSSDVFCIFVLDENVDKYSLRDFEMMLSAFCLEPISIDGITIPLSLKGGLAVYPDDVSDISQLLNYANFALLEARNNHNAAVVELDRGVFDNHLYKQGIIRDLSEANVSAEFLFYYQPVIDLTSGHVVSVEALLRWEHPEKGLLYPKDFIEILSKSNKIADVTNIMFDKLLGDISRLHATTTRQISAAFNLSLIDMNIPHKAERIIEIFENYKLDPSFIYFEILESISVSANIVVQENISKLHNYGFSISLDDFGTEYSSLSLLETIHYDVIKVDKSFVHNGESFSRGKILLLIREIADVYGKRCIVEGVETLEQLRFIKSLGFNYVQGFYYSKAVPLYEIESMILENIQQ